MRVGVAAAAVALALAVPAAAFTPADPLAATQWYLAANRTFDAWAEPPALQPVKVGVIDSGIDRGNPNFKGRIAAARSFVGGTPDDEEGHGTIVAGIIAANTGDDLGIAGSSPSAQLLVAKVVDRDGSVPVDAEARGIRWAVDAGARVINVSLGGLRDPADDDRDTFSDEERDAVEYAVAHGVLVVAAVGNGDQAPVEPWRYASYPAALPQVVGVGALARSGRIPAFSNRDPMYLDLVAPGEGIVSTFPRTLTARVLGCAEQGSTLCAGGDYRAPEGTSFAAPQVTAAAALLLALRPRLRAEQVRTILERTAVDVTAADGCSKCAVGRDHVSGFGRLDVEAAVGALAREVVATDLLEPNDDAGPGIPRLWGTTRTIAATVDPWDDPSDVYAVQLRAGQRLDVRLRRPPGTMLRLSFWAPEAESVVGREVADRLASVDTGGPAHLAFRAPTAGLYPVVVSTLGDGKLVPYRLSVEKT